MGALRHHICNSVSGYNVATLTDPYVKASRLIKLLLFIEWALNQCLDADPRVTILGSWLRRAKLDELPQIWNIMRGDMSFVGPRPFLPSQQPIYDACDDANAYYTLRPGVTGPWQLDRNRDKRFVLRSRYDARYLRDASVVTDCALLLRTAIVPIKVLTT